MDKYLFVDKGSAFIGARSVRIQKVKQEHQRLIAETGEPASQFPWTGAAEEIDTLRGMLESGCGRALLALPENTPSKERTEALTRYIAATKEASRALEEVWRAIADIEDSV